MKILVLTIIALFVAMGFTGCAPALLDGVNPEGKNYNAAYAVNNENYDFEIYTTEGSNPKEKLDILIKTAATHYKTKGVEYFSMTHVNPLITNYKDSLEYCYPNAFGLEAKCKGLENERLVLHFRSEAVNYYKPQWSVKEVLANITPQDKKLILKEVKAKDLVIIK